MLRISFAAGALALFGCLVTIFVARVFPGGHPPLADYFCIIAVPLSCLLALIGGGLAIAARTSIPRRRILWAMASNLAALVTGVGILFLWPLLRAA